MSFTLLEERRIPELDALARLYIHDGTKAPLLSILAKDENKTFGISFRTPPGKSDGVAHILEHSVLCGSRKYPVKEPFVELIKGSLNTFLNAFTYPDKTVYPLASTNEKDFYNLIDVYLDAVFNPLLTEDTFRQEGWHYEVDPATKALSYKGVVYNEMKGAYSDPDDLHDDLCRRSLYPDTAYGLDSGGDPAVIPSLDFKAFSDFHRTYYHPSNSFIYFYGDDDPEKRLEFLDGWLSKYGYLKVESLPGLQPAFQEPRKVMATYEGKEPKAWVALNWALAAGGTSADGKAAARDTETSLALSILSHILIGTPSSPLHVALIDSGLGEDLAGFGLEESLRQSAWSVGLKGVDPEETNEVEEVVLSTLGKLAQEGIDPKAVAASMNTIEFALREKNTGRFPRGLAVMLEALNEWLYGANPLDVLSFEEPLAAVKEGIAKGGYFEALIKRWLLDNPHRTSVHLFPDAGAEEARLKAEKEALETAKASMSPARLEEVQAQAARLKELQEKPDSPEALATIPSLSLADLPPKTAAIPSESYPLADGATLLYHDLPTSGILYLDLAFPLDGLEDRLIPYAGILGRLLLEMGTDLRDYIELGQEIGIHTGGVSATALAASAWKTQALASYFILRAKTLAHGAPKLFELLGEVLTRAKLDDKERLRQIVLEEKADAESSVIPAGHRLVSLRLRSGYTEADAMSERMGGMEQLLFLRGLSERIDSDWPGVLADLKALVASVVNARGAVANVTLDRENLSSLRPALEVFISALPNRSRDARPIRPVRAIPSLELLSAPSQVSFVGTAFPLSPADPRAGSFLVAKKYLDTTFLWEKVRVQGGAYGGFTSYEFNSGLFTFLSYRDPNLESTIDLFSKAGEFLTSASPSREEIVRSIVGTIGDVDAYMLPDAKGFTSLVHYLTGYGQADRQAMRDRILGTVAGDFAALGEALAAAAPRAKSAAIASAQKAEEARTKLGTGEILKLL
ncbi:MAG: insulinase family protein [Spirochaetota bacterium]